MKQIEFNNYDHYIEAQKRTIGKRGIGPYFCDMEIIRIAQWCKQNNLQVRKGICHGARNGLECDELMRHLPHASIFGTDLFPFSGKSASQKWSIMAKSRVDKWDFNKINNDWVDAFDLVYTNSLDHAMNPEEVLKVWLDQLVWNGALFIQWNRSDIEIKSGDCFGSTPLEMIDLLNSVGVLADMLYVKIPWQRVSYLRRHGIECIVFVVQKRREEWQ